MCFDWCLMVIFCSVLPIQIYSPSGTSPGHWSQQGLCGSDLLAGRPWLQALPCSLPPQRNAASLLCSALARPQREGSGFSPKTPDSSWHDQSTAGVAVHDCDWWLNVTVAKIIMIRFLKNACLIAFSWSFSFPIGFLNTHFYSIFIQFVHLL